MALLARLRPRDAARKKLKARIQGKIVARPRSVSPKVDRLRVDQEFKEARMNSKGPNSLRFTGSASQGRQIRHLGEYLPVWNRPVEQATYPFEGKWAVGWVASKSGSRISRADKYGPERIPGRHRIPPYEHLCLPLSPKSSIHGCREYPQSRSMRFS